MNRLAWVFAAFWLAGLCDYAVQAPWWGWRTFGVPVNSDAPKWHWLVDWIPHDPWHVWQWLRNLTWMIGVSIAMIPLLDWLRWPYAVIAVLVMYAVSRGLSSSILMRWRR